MPRPQRPLGAECTYHVLTRGNNRQAIVTDDIDRDVLLRALDQVVRHRRWKLLAYCLMGNHVHLALTTPRPDLSDGLRDLLSRYARLHNRHTNRTGHLFEKRFTSILVKDDRQLLTTIRYISRNPVAAGLVRAAEQWPWGSYGGLIGRFALVPSFDTEAALSLFHPNPGLARHALRCLVEDPWPGDRMPDPHGSRGPSILTLRQALGVNRAMAAAAELGHTHQEIATAFELTRSAVTKRLARMAGPSDHAVRPRPSSAAGQAGLSR